MSTLADQMGFEVTYHGLNGVGQHLFANGQPFVTDVCNSLDEAVSRFGKRIDTRKGEFFYALMYMEGHTAAINYRPYVPSLKDAQSLKEYGLGYIQGIYDRPVKADEKTPEIVPPPATDEEPKPEAPKPKPKPKSKAKKKGGKKRKAAKKAAILDID